MKGIVGLINVGNVHKNIIAFIFSLIFEVFLAELIFSNKTSGNKWKIVNCMHMGSGYTLNMIYLHVSSSRSRTVNHVE
jgi:hypothetical protein